MQTNINMIEVTKIDGKSCLVCMSDIKRIHDLGSSRLIQCYDNTEEELYVVDSLHDLKEKMSIGDGDI